jgi:hypothetical protein
MNRLQLSPMSVSGRSSSTRSYPRVEFGNRRGSARWEDVKFFRSWLVYDSELEASRSRGAFNWNFFLGFTIALAISIAGWYGAAVLLRHSLR